MQAFPLDLVLFSLKYNVHWIYIYAWACVFTCADVYALARGVIGLLHMFMNFFCDGLHYEISKSRCLNSLAIQIRFKESQLERTSCNSSCLVIGFVREE